jgi:hypothetical protein
MSEPKRYAIRGFSAALVEEDNGVFVRYEDYARLKAEVERLCITEQNQTDRIISLEDCIQVLKEDRDGLLYEESEQVKRLKAEVERLDGLCKQLSRQQSDISCENIMLRKAGDLMAGVIGLPVNTVQCSSLIDSWNAAKEARNNG